MQSMQPSIAFIKGMNFARKMAGRPFRQTHELNPRVVCSIGSHNRIHSVG